MIAGENPTWTDEQVRIRAFQVFSSLYRQQLDWNNAQRRFHRHALLTGLDVEQLEEPTMPEQCGPENRG